MSVPFPSKEDDRANAQEDYYTPGISARSRIWIRRFVGKAKQYREMRKALRRANHRLLQLHEGIMALCTLEDIENLQRSLNEPR